MDIPSKFPYFYYTLNEYTDQVPPVDLDLSEYSLCNKISFNLNNYILGLDSFMKNQYPAIKEIELEKTNFEATEDSTHENLFEELLNFMGEHADEYTLEFGDGLTISPTFVYGIKHKFLNNDYLSKQKWFKDIMELDTQPKIENRPYLSDSFVSSLRQNLIQGVIEKLAYNFQGSEFVIGFNLFILEYNNEIQDLENYVKSIRDMAQYLYDNCTYCEKYVTKKMKYFDRVLLKQNRYTTEGKLNYEGWVYKDMTQTTIDRVAKVKRITRIIVDNSIASIKSKIKTENLPLNHVAFPNTNVTELEVEDNV